MNKFLKKYIKIFCIIMGVYFVFYGTGVGLYIYSENSEPAYLKENQVTDWERLGKVAKEKEKENTFSAPVRTTFLLVGLDKIAGLTDTLIVGNFNSITGEISLVSVPRDLYTVLERDKIKELNEAGKNPPSYFKLNSLYAYAGRGERGIKYLKSEISEIMGIDIDYYVMIDTAGFRNVVDTIGGIDFDVPQRLYYNDPGQDLYIDLQPGYQHLNGSQAEGLVRFRKGYADQDISRMNMQREFLKVFMKKVLSTESLSNNLSGLIKDFMEYVETDITLADVAKYLSCVDVVDPSKVKSTVLPCEGSMIDGAYYFELQEEEAKKVIDEYIFGIDDEPETETTTQESTLSSKKR